MPIGVWEIGFPERTRVVASLYEDGEFILSGRGDTKKFVSWELIPWKGVREKICSVRFEEGVCPASIRNWFYGCENLRRVENLPEGIKDMSIAFCGCVNLTELPTIPASTADLDEAFIDCRSLTSFPEIPENVIYTCDTFVNCTQIRGRMLLKGNLRQYAYMFQGACTAPGAVLTIDYASSLEYLVEEIAATGTEGSKLQKGEPRL